jgi:hypothetical protein
VRVRKERQNNLRKQRRGSKEGSKAKKEGRELQCTRERKERKIV